MVAVLAGFFDIWLLQKTSGSIQTAFYGLSYGIAANCFLFTSAMTPIITRKFRKAYVEGAMITYVKLILGTYLCYLALRPILVFLWPFKVIVYFLYLQTVDLRVTR